MVGKITAAGVLKIKRGGEFVSMICPLKSNAANIDCSHLCPLFGNPKKQTVKEEVDLGGGLTEIQKIKVWTLDLCQNTTLHFKELEDNR